MEKTFIEKRAEQIIEALNEYAVRYDRYEFGLPMGSDGTIKDMKDIVIKILEGKFDTNHQYVKRNFFVEGDAVVTEDGRNMVYSHAQGFDMKVLYNPETKKTEGYSGKIQWADGFNPGMVHEMFQ